MIKAHNIFDNDDKGKNGGTGHRILIEFDFRLVEMLESEDVVLDRMKTELKDYFETVRKTIKRLF